MVNVLSLIIFVKLRALRRDACAIWGMVSTSTSIDTSANELGANVANQWKGTLIQFDLGG